ncbi:MAG: MarR family transcriptional regulator [Propionibacteriales bacterium]|nr:MarR family transcriptional regulator [Propionibacteriales bacterium]
MARRSGRDELGVEAWAAFIRAHAAVVSRIEEQLQRRQRLPIGWYDVLLELNSAPGRRLRMQELGRKVTLSRSRVSRIIDDLTAAGLADREADPDDRRGSFAVITVAGRKVLRSAAPVYLRAIDEFFTSHLTDAQLRTLRDSLNRVRAAADDSSR